MASGKGQGSMSLSMKLIRLLIVLFNLAFVVLGIALLVMGVFILRDPKMQQLRPLLSTNLANGYTQNWSNIEMFAITLIAIGSALLFIGFLGCCGAIKGFKFLHLIYAGIIILIILAEVTIIVLFFTYQSRFRSELVDRLQLSIQKFYVGTPTGNASATNPISLSWDFTQYNLQCCGAVSKNDFSRAENWTRINPYEGNATNLVVPFTCCPLDGNKNWAQLPSNLSSATTCAKTGTNAYSRGCYDRILDLVLAYKQYIIIGAAVVLLVEVLAVVFAFSLYCRKTDYNTL